MGITKAIGVTVTYAAVMARAAAYGIRAARTRQAVERMQDRFEDRAASARYLSEAMTILSVDEPTTTAYMEISTISHAMAGSVAAIVSASDALATAAQGLAGETESQHGRMADANRTHSVQMADRSFNQRR
ncbi:hypothetical protein ACIPW5_11375 [Streptomyces sp. NPDC090077]|uniref:hypothetical protein n=1 Tax=Streptomyces sp. NPDC090077 TaxID=3365938 RepID=UPI0038049B9C